MDYKPGISLYPTSGAQPRLGPYVPEVHIPDEATKEQRKRAVRTFSLTFFALFLFDLCASLVIYGIQFGTIFLYGESGATYLFENVWFTYGAQAVAMYLIAFPIYYLVLRKLPKSDRTGSRMSGGEFILTFIIMQAATYIFSYVANFVNIIVEYLVSDYVRYDVSTEIIPADAPILPVIIAAVILAPIVEELMFRKIMIDRLSVYGDRLALVVSSVSFALFHGNVTQGIYTIIGGLAFGYVYIKSRNVKLSILLHMLMNFVGSVPGLLLQGIISELPDDLSTLTEQQMIELMPTLLIMLGYLLFIGAITITGIVLFIVFAAKRKIYVRRSGMILLRKRTVIHALFFTLGTLLFAITIVFKFTSSLGITLDYIGEIIMLIRNLIG